MYTEEKKLDKNIASWILEMIVQRAPDHLVKKVIADPHFSMDNDSGRFKRMLLLRSIDTLVNDRSISEEILDSLELIEEIEMKEGLTITDSMKKAYCAVAVDLTAKCLGGTRYSDAVKRIWESRITHLEFVKKSHLVTVDLRRWKHCVKAAAPKDSMFRERLIEYNTRDEALSLTQAYVTEAKDLIGPSFLELVAKAERVEKQKERCVQSSSDPGQDKSGLADSSIQPAAAGKTAITSTSTSTEIPWNISLQRHKRAAQLRRYKGQAQITNDPDQLNLNLEATSTKSDTLLTTEVKRTELNLNLEDTSTKSDTLPTIEVKRTELNLNLEDTSTKSDTLPTSEVKRTNPQTTNDDEQDDSIEDSPDETINHPIRLDSPKRIQVSPLESYEAVNLNKRKKIKKWSEEEENVLRKGVEEIGKGNWKAILNANSDVFVGRTEVNLKDKWRNLTMRHRQYG